MDIIAYFYVVIDHYLMLFFRVPDNPLVGYYLGSFVLSIACVLTGECSLKLALRLNKKNIIQANHEIDLYQNLSIKALKTGDKAAYKACNSIANEAFGKNFFSQIALSASSLWPVFIALGWMQYRFAEVEFSFPFLGDHYSFGYISTFIFCYIISRFLFGRIKRKLRNIIFLCLK